MADETPPDRTHADGEHRPLRLGHRPRNPRMEQRDPTRPKPRRRPLADHKRRRAETLHILALPPTEMPKHRSGIPDGLSTPPAHRTEPPRDTLHELYPPDGLV